MKISTQLTKKNVLSRLVLATLISIPVVTMAAPPTYLIVIPLDGQGAVTAPKITVTLLAAALPAATVNEPYAHDLNGYLQIAGNSSYDPSLLSWSAVNLPEGLALSNQGVLSGALSQVSETDTVINVRASYAGKAVSQQYLMTVVPITLALDGGSRRWSNGAYAASCESYRRPISNYRYEGAVGTGVYRIAPGGIEPFDIRCDMDSDGGGWTLVEYAEDLAFKRWFLEDKFQWLPAPFKLNLTEQQINAIRRESTQARQRYVGLCEGVVHYYYISSSDHQYAVGFRYHTGVTTNWGSANYTPASIKVVQDGCRVNGKEGGRLGSATIFDIENINLPVINIITRDSGDLGELFGSPLTQYPVRFR